MKVYDIPVLGAEASHEQIASAALEVIDALRRAPSQDIAAFAALTAAVAMASVNPILRAWMAAVMTEQALQLVQGTDPTPVH